MGLGRRLLRLLGIREMQIDDKGRNLESVLYAIERCHCAQLGTRRKLGVGWDVLGEGLAAYDYETIRQRTPWLDLVRCSHCGRHWYVATDDVDDDVYMALLSDEETRRILDEGHWPTTFDRLRNVAR